MATEHMCGNEWKPGGVRDCDSTNHDKRGKKQPRVKGIQEKRRLDAQAGVIGTQRDGFITGH